MHRIFLRFLGLQEVGLLWHLLLGCAAAVQWPDLWTPSARQCSSKMTSQDKVLRLTQPIQDRNKERGAV